MNLLKKWLKTISNLFKNKNQHGFARYCLSGKCEICKTPWPKIPKTFTEEYLESINYYDNYVKITIDKNILYMPKGLTGEEIINIAKILKPKYDILSKGKSEEEVAKRGALEGHDQK